ncbi:ABC transporter ATP-binding protein [Candidatus Dependentiae bacterium]|nr:ABC transporter ATP-binding protein [Candidatus Dependentiae bacterium]
MTEQFVIELKNIVKRFGKVTANKNVNLAVKKAEVHAIVGENGAGKSTLMKTLYGLYQPDEGEIFINGERIESHSPNNAIKHKIGMVHQHFMLVPPLTVSENVILGMEITSGLKIDICEADARIKKLSDEFNLSIDPSKKIEDLSVGENQRVEIIKVLYRGAEILILDEPTAVLTPQEVREFFKVIKSLVTQGKTVIIITHKLDEVIEISDNITVMRQGETVGSIETKKTTPQEIAKMMVGRDVLLRVEKNDVVKGNEIISVKNLSVRKNKETLALDSVSFEINAGEILGIAGVEGNGQTELIESIMNLNKDKIVSGEIKFLNTDVSEYSTFQRLESGVSHIPEDRHKRGLVLEYNISDNLILGQQHLFTSSGFLKQNDIYKYSDERIAEFDIRPNDKNCVVRGLSGGNQQKVIIAREFNRDFKLLIAAQPTRGVDIGAIEFIHKQILKARENCKACLLISAELSEILSLSDRVAVLYKGRIVKILETKNTNENELGMLMTGAVK